jgi:multidrug efflux pump
VGTLLTIFVVPTMYTLFARKTAPGAIKTELNAVYAHPVLQTELVANK